MSISPKRERKSFEEKVNDNNKKASRNMRVFKDYITPKYILKLQLRIIRYLKDVTYKRTVNICIYILRRHISVNCGESMQRFERENMEVLG